MLEDICCGGVMGEEVETKTFIYYLIVTMIMVNPETIDMIVEVAKHPLTIAGLSTVAVAVYTVIISSKLDKPLILDAVRIAYEEGRVVEEPTEENCVGLYEQLMRNHKPTSE